MFNIVCTEQNALLLLFDSGTRCLSSSFLVLYKETNKAKLNTKKINFYLFLIAFVNKANPECVIKEQEGLRYRANPPFRVTFEVEDPIYEIPSNPIRVAIVREEVEFHFFF